MKLNFSLKYCSFILLLLVGCKKVTPGDSVVSLVVPVTNQTVILPQTDPGIAKSEGFFLNDWAPKSFVKPTFTDAASITTDATVTVNVDYSNVITKVPKYLFGNNSNPYMGQLVTEPVLMNYVKNLSPNIIRFPGGNISSVFIWNGLVGQPPADAPVNINDATGASTPANYWYGNNTANWTLSVDNYYAALVQTGSTGIITINYSYARYGTGKHPDQSAAHLAADWVRYDKGRTKYWEIGNESDGPWQAGWRIDTTKNQDGQPQIITGFLYGKHFKVFADSMRKAALEVGAVIKIGAQLVQTDPTNSWNNVDRTWNFGLFSSAGDYPDYYIVHDYYTAQTNVDAATILNTPVAETKAIMDFMGITTQQGRVLLKPIALTEWNIFASGSKQMVSNIAGIHADMVLGELLKNKFGMASRWDLSNGYGNGDDHGMFSKGDEPDNTTKWSPRPTFYHMYLFQKYFGDRMVGSTVSGNADILTYASSFSSGEAGVIVVNKGTTNQVISIKITNFAAGNRFYYYTLVGGSDNGDFSRQVFINGAGPAMPSGGPANYLQIAPFSSTFTGSIKVNAPARSVIYLIADKSK